MEDTALDRLQNLISPDPASPVSSEHIAVAIAGVIQTARSQGQSLEDLTAEVLADDSLLDQNVRRLLSDIVAQAWETLPYSSP